MKILYLGNNWTGWRVLQGLKERDEQIVGLVVHPADKASHRDEILEAAGLEPARVFQGPSLRDPATLEAIAALGADMAVSVFFGYILRPEFLRLFPRETINLHPGYLPYNRGIYTNVFSILENTPAGVTLHYVDRGMDTGDIIARREVAKKPSDTGETLYRRQERACLDLFFSAWPEVKAGVNQRTPQDPGQGTTHGFADLEGLDEIKLGRQYSGRELIDLLRARTFPPYRGAYFRHGDKKIHLRLELEEE
jgi:methionyl-tRNA formyltransferase